MNINWRSLACRWALALFVVAAGAARAAGAGSAEPAGAALISHGLEGGALRLMAGKSLLLTTSRPYRTVSVAESEIVDVNPVGPTTLLVTAKKAGMTQLVLIDDNNRSQMVDVFVASDVAALQQQLKLMFPGLAIEAADVKGTIVLRGRVPNLTTAQQAVQVAGPFGGKVLNLLEVSGGQQVMLQVRFAEVSRAATTALGINGMMAAGSFIGGSNIGQVNPLNQFKVPGAGDTPAPQGFDLDRTISPSVTLFAAGQIGSVYLDAFVQALRQNNLLRILAEPNLVAVSGEEASFLAGGEFPVPVAGGAQLGGSSAVTVEYREFGVKLVFTPIVTGDGRIRLKVSPEVSDIDFTTAVKFNGFVVPGLQQRKVTTTIELAEGQTFAIAGLLSHNIASTREVTPLLGDLPVVGALFRSVRYQRKETELIVLVTPRLVEAMSAGQVPPAPGQNWRHPTESDLLLRQDIGGPVQAISRPATRPVAQTPQFFGQYGFNPVD